MPPSGDLRPSRPSANERRLSSLRELASNPSFSRFTSSGRITAPMEHHKPESDRLPQDRPGMIADRYLVEVPIHENKAMSSVYLAKDMLTRELVVVKMASDPAAKSMSTLSMRREQRALSRIRHPNVVRMRDSGCHEGKMFVVLDYIPGEDLYILQGGYGRLPWSLAGKISLQLCDALGAAHERGVVHDDMKPENIIITLMGGLKATLLDFGLAKFMDSALDDDLRITPGIVVGTFPYMAPETFDMPHYDHRADIYSLGVVIYEMVAGRNPFDGENIPEVVDRIINYDPEPPGRRVSLPGCADSLIMRAIAKEPKHRFCSTSEMRAAILSCT
ncbi:MAG: serine/threonine-protein kinase [Candidatus Micrarchaeota archaeon]